MPDKPKDSRWLYFLLGLYILASMSYYVANISGFIDKNFDLHHRVEAPFDFDPDTLAITTVRQEAKQAGVAPGDVLLTLYGKPYAGQVPWLNLIRDTLHPGDTLTLGVRRPDGSLQTAQILLAGRASGGHVKFQQWGGILLLFGIPPLICLLVGYWVVVARPRDVNAWLILFILTFPEILFSVGMGWWPGWWAVWSTIWMLIQQVLSPVALLLFGIYFPERWRLDSKLPWVKYALIAPLAAGVPILTWVLIGQDFHGLWTPVQTPINTWTGRVFTAFAMACITFYFIALQSKYHSGETAPDAKRRLRVLLIGSEVGLGALFIAFAILPLFHIEVNSSWVGIVGATVFLAFPFTLAYVVVVQRAMDVRILLRMGTKYALAKASLTVLRTGLLTGLCVLLVQAVRAPALTAKMAIGIAVLAGLLLLLRMRLTRNLSSWLDRRFFREAYNSEQLLAELSQRVRKYNDSGPMLEMVLKSLAQTLHIDKIGVLLRGGNSFQLQQAVGLDGFAHEPVHLPLNSTTVRNLMRINTPVKLYREDPDGWLLLASASERSLLDSMSTELLLPLSGRDQLMGLMTLGPKRSEEPYTPSDLRLLESVATQTGLALEIGNLARSLASEAMKRERIDREIEVAREVQERLFPQDFPVIEGVTVAGHCRPQQGIGGDYYDVFVLGDDRIGIAMGDVSGKGISAALLMASLRASLRGMTLDAPHDLAVVIEKVNRLVYEASATNRYATFFFATYCASTRELVYVNAGHNAPFLVRRTGEEFQVQRLEAGGPVVGLLSFAIYEEQRLVLQPGDLLLTYTDGISEAMTLDDEEWGEERMLASAQTLPDGTAQEVLDHLFAEADRFTGKAPQFDDMTLLVMKLTPKPVASTLSREDETPNFAMQ